MQPSELMPANVSRAFALLVELFCFLWRPQEARKNFLDHTEVAAPCGDVPKPVGVGIRQHFYHLRPQGQSSVLSIHAEGGSPRPGWAGGIGTSSASSILSWNLTKTNSWKRHMLFVIHQCSHGLQNITLGSPRGQGLWNHFPKGFRFATKQSCRPSNGVRSTVKALHKCPQNIK